MVEQWPKDNMHYQLRQIRCVIMAKLTWLHNDTIGPDYEIQDAENNETIHDAPFMRNFLCEAFSYF
jgi:hypothetical protein